MNRSKVEAKAIKGIAVDLGPGSLQGFRLALLLPKVWPWVLVYRLVFSLALWQSQSIHLKLQWFGDTPKSYSALYDCREGSCEAVIHDGTHAPSEFKEALPAGDILFVGDGRAVYGDDKLVE